LIATVGAGSADAEVRIASVTAAGSAVAYGCSGALTGAVAYAGGTHVGITVRAGCTYIGRVNAAAGFNDIAGTFNRVWRANAGASGHREAIAKLAIAAIVRGSACIDLAQRVGSGRAGIGRTGVRKAAAIALREIPYCAAGAKAAGVARITGAADFACHNTAVTFACAGVASITPLRDHTGALCIEHVAIVAIASNSAANRSAALPIRIRVHRAGTGRDVTGVAGTGLTVCRLVKAKRGQTFIAVCTCIAVGSVAKTRKPAALGLCARPMLATARAIGRTDAILLASSALFVASQRTGTDRSAALKCAQRLFTHAGLRRAASDQGAWGLLFRRWSGLIIRRARDNHERYKDKGYGLTHGLVD
jgi:hypothetical protein